MDLDLDHILSAGLIEKLIGQDRPYRDRATAYDEGWQSYDNFGEFYQARKHLFIVRYSRSELLIARIMQLYIVEQLHGAVVRDESTPPPGARDRLNDAVRSAIKSDLDRLLGLLKTKWPAEYAAIEALNSTSATVR